eukprot:evm.model.scf_724.7 EVM.evm.TU.scf_724.7   scf_724:64291-67005(-)
MGLPSTVGPGGVMTRASLLSQDADADYWSGDCPTNPGCGDLVMDMQAYMLRISLEVVAITLCSWICVWLISRNEQASVEQTESLRVLEGSLRRAAQQEVELRSRVTSWQEKARAAEEDNARLAKLADGYEERAKTAEDCLAGMKDTQVELIEEVASKSMQIMEARKRQLSLEALSNEQADRIAEITIKLTNTQEETDQSRSHVKQLQAERVAISTTLGTIPAGRDIPQVAEVKSLLAIAEEDIAHQKLKVSALEKDQRNVLAQADSLVGQAKQQSTTFAEYQERLAVAERQIEAYRSKFQVLERNACSNRGSRSRGVAESGKPTAVIMVGVSAESSRGHATVEDIGHPVQSVPKWSSGSVVVSRNCTNKLLEGPGP